MCGIAGFQGDFGPTLLPQMSARIAHRGPDDEGMWSDPKAQVALAHRRLSIIDTSSAGHQPMSDRLGRATIAYNGELYNFRELRPKLEARGSIFRGNSDTEVLLQQYLVHGADMLNELNGIFALAIWDQREGRLLLARDGLGVKPLYYAQTSHGFIFASELKALLQSPHVSRDLDPTAVYDHLCYLWCPNPATVLKSVRKLEPGHALTVRDGRIDKHWSFYDLPYDTGIEEQRDEEAIRGIEEGLAQAVRRQMVSDVPVGAFLSGGIDSSLIVANARQHSPQRLQCFTISRGTETAGGVGAPDDFPYAQRVARHLDVDLHVVQANDKMFHHIEHMLYHLDEPQADPAPINVWLISQLAREHGIKVLLSGAGGDDIFTGYKRHRALNWERNWAWLPKGARSSLAWISSRIPTHDPRLRRIAKVFQYADQSPDQRLLGYFRWLPTARAQALFSPDFTAQLGKSAFSGSLANTLCRVPPGTKRLNQMLYLDTKHFLADHNLNYTDKMSMATGVEVRVPFLDLDLVAQATRLPLCHKQRGKEGKWVLKKLAERVLPRDIVYRPKAGFGAPLRSWLHGPLRPLREDLLSSSSLIGRGIFAPLPVAQLVEDDRNGKIDAAYPIFAMMCLELWCRIFIDPTSPQRPSVID